MYGDISECMLAFHLQFPYILLGFVGWTWYGGLLRSILQDDTENNVKGFPVVQTCCPQFVKISSTNEP